ncbi:MAG: protein disulfide oxidoreductase [Pseudomonadota bacterium]
MNIPNENTVKPSLWRRKALRWLLEGLLIIGVFVAIQAYQKRDVSKGMVPPLAAVTIDGTPVNLAASRTRPVLVHFWATWCQICRLEQGSIQNLARDYAVISIASQSGSAAEIARFMGERKLTFPVVADTQGDLAGRFGVRAFPSSFVVDKSGMIRFVEIGYTTEAGLRARLAWLDE